jgi:hypothetical protein
MDAACRARFHNAAVLERAGEYAHRLGAGLVEHFLKACIEEVRAEFVVSGVALGKLRIRLRDSYELDVLPGANTGNEAPRMIMNQPDNPKSDWGRLSPSGSGGY